MTVWVAVGGRKRRVELRGDLGFLSGSGAVSSAGDLVECLVDGVGFGVEVFVLQPGVMSVVVRDGAWAGRQFRCVLDGDGVVVDGRRHEFAVEDPRSLRGREGAGTGTDGPRAVKAPMPGRVVRVLVAVGDAVEEQQGLVVIEAMKMQNELRSPKAGRVVKLAVGVGDTVGAGEVLAVVE